MSTSLTPPTCETLSARLKQEVVSVNEEVSVEGGSIEKAPTWKRNGKRSSGSLAAVSTSTASRLRGPGAQRNALRSPGAAGQEHRMASAQVSYILSPRNAVAIHGLKGVGNLENTGRQRT